MPSKGSSLELRFGPHLLGVIEGAFWSDNTGYGVFSPVKTEAEIHDPMLAQIWEYVSFSEGWHTRLKMGRPHDGKEWRAYDEFIQSKQWHTITADGMVEHIECPVFVEGEVTWGPPPDNE